MKLYCWLIIDSDWGGGMGESPSREQTTMDWRRQFQILPTLEETLSPVPMSVSLFRTWEVWVLSLRPGPVTVHATLAKFLHILLSACGVSLDLHTGWERSFRMRKFLLHIRLNASVIKAQKVPSLYLYSELAALAVLPAWNFHVLVSERLLGSKVHCL